jgi:hypothetical protein
VCLECTPLIDNRILRCSFEEERLLWGCPRLPVSPCSIRTRSDHSGFLDRQNACPPTLFRTPLAATSPCWRTCRASPARSRSESERPLPPARVTSDQRCRWASRTARRLRGRQRSPSARACDEFDVPGRTSIYRDSSLLSRGETQNSVGKRSCKKAPSKPQVCKSNADGRGESRQSFSPRTDTRGWCRSTPHVARLPALGYLQDAFPTADLPLARERSVKKNASVSIP